MDWLDRMTSVMDIISQGSTGGIGLTEIARQTLLSKGTLHRMLKDMVKHQLIAQDQVTKRYTLGPKSMLWGSQFLRGQDPTGLLARYCIELAEKTGFYAYLCRFQVDQIYCIYTHQPSNVRNKYFVHVGQRMPAHCAASAKAILAFQDTRSVEVLLQKEPFKKYTSFTKRKMDQIWDELHETSNSFISLCEQELEVGVTAISTPIFHKKKSTFLSLSIVGETHEINLRKDALIQELLFISERASEHMASMYLLSSLVM